MKTNFILCFLITLGYVVPSNSYGENIANSSIVSEINKLQTMIGKNMTVVSGYQKKSPSYGDSESSYKNIGSWKIEIDSYKQIVTSITVSAKELAFSNSPGPRYEEAILIADQLMWNSNGDENTIDRPSSQGNFRQNGNLVYTTCEPMRESKRQWRKANLTMNVAGYPGSKCTVNNTGMTGSQSNGSAALWISVSE